MEFELRAGGKINLLTAAEAGDAIRGALKDWQAEAVRGARSIRFSSYATIAGGNVQVGGTDGYGAANGVLGPEAGFVWSVKRLAFTGIVPATETLNIYVNSASPFELVRSGVTTFERFGSDELVLIGAERLLITNGTALTLNGTNLTVSGQAMELPIGMMWKLL